MKKILFLILMAAFGSLAAEDKVAFIKVLDDLTAAEQSMNDVIQVHNQQGFDLVKLTPIYAYQMEGSLQSKPIGTFKIPLSDAKFKWDAESTLDGSMKGAFSGKGYPSHLMLKFHK